MSDRRTNTLPPTPTTNGLDLSGRGASSTPRDKIQSLQQVQDQAEQRIKLGTQLLKAAEAHTSQGQSAIDKVRREQNQLRDKLEQDVTQALSHYDEWIAGVEESLTQRMEKVERRLASVLEQWESSEQRMTRMIKRAEALFDQSRSMLETVKAAISRKKAIRPELNTSPSQAPVQLNEEGPTMLYGKLMGKLYERGDGGASE